MQKNIDIKKIKNAVQKSTDEHTCSSLLTKARFRIKFLTNTDTAVHSLHHRNYWAIYVLFFLLLSFLIMMWQAFGTSGVSLIFWWSFDPGLSVWIELDIVVVGCRYYHYYIVAVLIPVIVLLVVLSLPVFSVFCFSHDCYY